MSVNRLRHAGGGGWQARLLLSACTTVGPDFKRPQVPWLADWTGGSLESLAADPRVPRSGQTQEWWRNFNDPVLDRLVAEAQRVNPNVRIAGHAHHGSARPTRNRRQHALPAGAAGNRRSARRGRVQVGRIGHHGAGLERRASASAGRSISGASSGAASRPRMPAISPASPSTMTCRC